MLISNITPRTIIADLLRRAEVQLDGPLPWDIRINDERALGRWIQDGFLGFGETYVEGAWDCASLDQLCHRLLKAGLWEGTFGKNSWRRSLASSLINLQSRSRARQVCEAHYDLGNDLYTAMLDSRMVYTCGYWKDASNLEQAQEAKLDLVCRKLGLEPGMKLLDIGCGFGSLMKHAAERFGVQCVGYSLSREQIRLGTELCRGLPIRFIEADYRDIEGSFDRVASIGMFEAVGARNFGTFMKVVAAALKPDGIALLHTMGAHQSHASPEPWFDKYIFPNGMLPSIRQIGEALEGSLVMEDWHCFGTHYDPTLMAWNERFQRAWPTLESRYPARFKRMWEFYLLSLAGCFRARHVELWQIILTRPGRAVADWRKQ